MAYTGHRVDVEVELESHTRSNQVQTPLSLILCTDLTKSQVDAEIEVVREKDKEHDSKEAETKVSKCPSADKQTFPDIIPLYVLPMVTAFRFDVSNEEQYYTKCKKHGGNFVRKM